MHRFSHAYRTTLGADFTTKTVTLPSRSNDNSSPRTVRLQIWDTAGSERFRALGSAFYRGADACVLVYSSTDKGSLEGLKGWMEEFGEKRPVLEEEEENFVWVAVGSKMDLIDEDDGARTPSGQNGDAKPSRPPEDAWKSHDSLGHGDRVTELQAQEYLKTLLPPPSEPDPGSRPIPVLIPPGYTRAEAREELDREAPAHPIGYNRTPPSAPDSPIRSRRRSPKKREDELEEEESSPYKGHRSASRKASVATGSEITILSIYHTPPSSLRHKSSGSGGDDDDEDDDDDAASVTTVTAAQRLSTEEGETAPTSDLEADYLDEEEPPTQDPPSTATSVPLPPPAENIDDEGNRIRPRGGTTPGIMPTNDPSTTTTVTADPSTSNPTEDDRRFPLFLTSAKTGLGVEELFSWLATACAAREERERARLEMDLDARGAMDERKRAEIKLREAREGHQGWFKRCCGS